MRRGCSKHTPIVITYYDYWTKGKITFKDCTDPSEYVLIAIFDEVDVCMLEKIVKLSIFKPNRKASSN